VLAVALATLASCSTAYYGAMEQIGKQKRHILADRVAAGRDDQREAQEQFQTALERFQAATKFDGGDLEATWRSLDAEYQRSEARAEDVRKRIRSIETVADDLFDEWDDEIGQIERKDLRDRSKRQRAETMARYEKLITAMRRAADKMDPVLTAFRDQVLFLKHNLNAAAIASLEGDVVDIRSDVDALVRDMQAAIREADAFLANLPKS
jgi:hypothetical protein